MPSIRTTSPSSKPSRPSSRARQNGNAIPTPRALSPSPPGSSPASAAGPATTASPDPRSCDEASKTSERSSTELLWRFTMCESDSPQGGRVKIGSAAPSPLPPRGGGLGRGAPTRYDYLRDPDAIYRESFARIRGEADLSALPDSLHKLALRLAHAVGDAGILRDLVCSEGAVAAGRAALAAGAPILTDAAMVKAGIITRRLPRRNRVLCLIGDKRVPALARRLATTRSAASVELWRPHLAGAIVAIGNAPTALFHLLEMIAAGAPKPALVLGFPVGFVGAAEAKAALAENALGLPFVALAGRRGGSALAAAAGAIWRWCPRARPSASPGASRSPPPWSRSRRGAASASSCWRAAIRCGTASRRRWRGISRRPRCGSCRRRAPSAWRRHGSPGRSRIASR